jgi:hypothetical protein
MQGYIWLTIWWQGCVYAPENDDKPLDFDVAHFQTNQFLLSGEKKTIQPIQPVLKLSWVLSRLTVGFGAYGDEVVVVRLCLMGL